MTGTVIKAVPLHFLATAVRHLSRAAALFHALRYFAWYSMWSAMNVAMKK